MNWWYVGAPALYLVGAFLFWLGNVILRYRYDYCPLSALWLDTGQVRSQYYGCDPKVKEFRMKPNGLIAHSFLWPGYLVGMPIVGAFVGVVGGVIWVADHLSVVESKVGQFFVVPPPPKEPEPVIHEVATFRDTPLHVEE